MNSLPFEGAWIATRSGGRFYPLDPDTEAVAIEDIAAGLASRFRFSGQSARRITVAQHCVLASAMCQQAGGSQFAQLWCLLHDAAEAYLPDVCRPLKPFTWFRSDCDDRPAMFPYETIETWILEAVAERFELPWPMPPIVREIDDRLLATERRDLFDGFDPGWTIEAEPYEFRIRPQAPDQAEEEFLSEYRSILSDRTPARART